jgi:hypothetical protein
MLARVRPGWGDRVTVNDGVFRLGVTSSAARSFELRLLGQWLAVSWRSLLPTRCLCGPAAGWEAAARESDGIS